MGGCIRDRDFYRAVVLLGGQRYESHDAGRQRETYAGGVIRLSRACLQSVKCLTGNTPKKGPIFIFSPRREVSLADTKLHTLGVSTRGSNVYPTPPR